MRRLLLLCLLVMLPFQGAWAAVAAIAALDSPCAMSQQATQHGAHGGDAGAQDDLPSATADCDGAVAEPCGDSGCGCCHAHTLVALISVPVALSAGTGGAVVTRNVLGAPDHIPEHPLRPPLLRSA